VTPRVYLAGPEVFHPHHARIFAEREAMCQQYDLKALVPLDNKAVTAIEIYRANVRLLDRCDAVIANITPFRGPHCDVGTAWEIGYAVARRKPIFGFSESSESLLHRAAGDRQKSRVKLDDIGMLVEDFGLRENLMIVMSLSQSKVHDSFEGALEAAADHLRTKRRLLNR